MDTLVYIIMVAAIIIAAELGYIILLLMLFRDRLLRHDDSEHSSSGMDLNFFAPKKRKAVKYTDKTRNWITERETASRR